MSSKEYQQFLARSYPSTKEYFNNNQASIPFCSQTIPLSSKAFQSMRFVVESLFALKKNSNYKEQILKEAPDFLKKEMLQDAILMAYDFHIDEQGYPRLIEVNTNASGFLLGNSFYQWKKQGYQEALESLKLAFQKEWDGYTRGHQLSLLRPQKVVIIDEKPLEQKMYLEFLMYQDFFQSMGWQVEICDSSSIKSNEEGYLLGDQGEQIDFIYNRSTDFYFKNHPHLLKAYQRGTCCISPHPREYFLLSDKKRLADWFANSEAWQLKDLKKYLIPSYLSDAVDLEQIWSDKKKYFFKPLEGYGGKGSYKGASITHKKWAELCKSSFLIQEYVPTSYSQNSQGEKWKVDFRAFVYRQEIQQVMARCYKGQMTNFREPGSGWALVDR
ncbi:MAG: hypothetical protein ACR2M7_01245 [Bdellovibrionales bacterium]